MDYCYGKETMKRGKLYGWVEAIEGRQNPCRGPEPENMNFIQALILARLKNSFGLKEGVNDRQPW